MKARGHGVIVNDIGAAGEKFDANYICGSARQRRADGVHPRARRQKPRRQYPRGRHQSGPVGTDRHVTLLKTRARTSSATRNRYKEFQKGMPLGRAAHAREIGDLMRFWPRIDPATRRA